MNKNTNCLRQYELKWDSKLNLNYNYIKIESIFYDENEN